VTQEELEKTIERFQRASQDSLVAETRVSDFLEESDREYDLTVTRLKKSGF
jgi:hypothetical protein